MTCTCEPGFSSELLLSEALLHTCLTMRSQRDLLVLKGELGAEVIVKHRA